MSSPIEAVETVFGSQLWLRASENFGLRLGVWQARNFWRRCNAIDPCGTIRPADPGGDWHIGGGVEASGRDHDVVIAHMGHRACTDSAKTTVVAAAVMLVVTQF